MTSARASPISPLIPASASRHADARLSRLVQLYGTITQKLPEPLTNNAYRRRTYKTHAKSDHTNPAKASLQPKSRAADNIKSP
jgi:hypothetical protein